LSIVNTAADITNGPSVADVNALNNGELPPAPAPVPGYGDVAAPPDANAAVNGATGAQIPPVPADGVQGVSESGAPQAPATIPNDVTSVGAAPVRTDATGRPIAHDSEGTPVPQKAKFTDISVWKENVQASVRESILAGKLVRRMSDKNGNPVYRFYH
jgi:hypothetical protein